MPKIYTRRALHIFMTETSEIKFLIQFSQMLENLLGGKRKIKTKNNRLTPFNRRKDLVLKGHCYAEKHRSVLVEIAPFM